MEKGSTFFEQETYRVLLISITKKKNGMIRLVHFIPDINTNLQYSLTFFAIVMPQRLGGIFHLWEETQIAILRRTMMNLTAVHTLCFSIDVT